MKNSKFIIATVLLSAVCASHNMLAHRDVLEPLHQKIKRDFIHRSSADVAEEYHEGHLLSKCFEEFKLKDQHMEQMIQSREENSGKFAFEVINKSDVIRKEFAHKRLELYKEYTASVRTEDRAQIGFFAGFIMGMAAICAKEKDLKNAWLPITAGGLGVMGYSAWQWYWSAQKQEQKQIHITELTKIEEKWDHTFSIPQKKSEMQKAADK